MITLNIHLLTIIFTFGFYVLLKSFKQSVLEQELEQNKKRSNLVYLLYIPLTLYVSYYVLTTKDIQTPSSIVKTDYSLPSVYPGDNNSFSSL